jgi:ornithine--oxo-acid transaminase
MNAAGTTWRPTLLYTGDQNLKLAGRGQRQEGFTPLREGGLLLSQPAIAPVLNSYAQHVNPQWAKLLDVMQMNVQYTRCAGAELWTRDGARVLDFLSGYCVHNTGHNHPRIVAALKDELDRNGAAMVQSHAPELAGELAAQLCRRAGGRIEKAFFCSSGSEAVEAAIKFARAHTGRPALLYCSGAFHGLTCGALSLMGDPVWREGFGPLLESEAVPFGNLEALEEALRSRRFAAFFVEPIQGEGGVRLPEAGYLFAAEALCRRYGTLLALDEVQTGLYRTGPFLAAHRYGVEPDMVVLAKALSGGLIPSGALLMSGAIYDSVYNSLKRAIVHTSTYSENSLAMRAGLETLAVLEDERLGERAVALGTAMRELLRAALAGNDMVRDIRGAGLLTGIEFAAPRQWRLRIAFEAFERVQPALFGQMLVMRLFTDRNILTQVCGNNFLVLKAAPPLVVNEAQIAEYVSAVAYVVKLVQESRAVWKDAFGLARRALRA